MASARTLYYLRVRNCGRRNNHSPRPVLVALITVFHVHLTNVPSTVEIRAVPFIVPAQFILDSNLSLKANSDIQVTMREGHQEVFFEKVMAMEIMNRFFSVLGDIRRLFIAPGRWFERGHACIVEVRIIDATGVLEKQSQIMAGRDFQIVVVFISKGNPHYTRFEQCPRTSGATHLTTRLARRLRSYTDGIRDDKIFHILICD